MKKVIVMFTGVYFKFDTVTKERKVLYNYVVVSGDSKQYSADKEATGHLSLQDNSNGDCLPEHVGLPRFVSTKNIGHETELNRVEKKDGSFDWYTDDTEAMLVSAEIGALPEFAKQAIGKELALEAIARAKATASALKAMKAKASEPKVTDLKKS